MSKRLNVLIVCGRNKRRSRTGEYIFKNDLRFNIRSAGLSPKSERQIGEKDILWADIILVMENKQKRRVLSDFQHMEIPMIEVLDISDDYEYLDEYLIEMLESRVNFILEDKFKI